MNRNRLRLGTAVAAIAAGVLALAQNVGFEFKEKSGKLTITNPGGSLKANRISKNDPNRFKVIMQAPANKQILAVWTEQDLTLRSRTFEAVTDKSGNRTEIETASLGGGVTATILRPTSQEGSNAKQTITLTSSALDFFGADNRAELKGGVTVDQKDPAASTTMTAKGASATVVLTDTDIKNAKGPIQSAVLQGAARITLTSVRTVTERERGKPAVRVKRQFNIVLTGDRVHFQLAKGGDDYGVIIVTGNVNVTGDDPVLFGNITGVKKLTLKLDSQMQPYDLESEGDPTVTKLTEKKPG